MPLISRLGAASSRGFGQFTQQVSGKYIEDYFSTYLYTGNGTSQTINNGIGLSDTAAWNGYKLKLGAGVGYGVDVDSSGNFYVTGTSNDGSQYWLVAKYNSFGILQWQRKVSLGTTSAGTAIKVDSSGNVYVTGNVRVSTTPVIILIKYDSSGVLQWQRRLNQGNSSATGLVIAPSGNIYVSGYASGATWPYLILAKYDSSGAIQWQRSLSYGGTYVYGTGQIDIDSSENIYLTGYHNASNIRAIVVKYNSSGTLQWQRDFFQSGVSTIGYSTATDSSANVYVVGYHNAAFLAKYNTSGVLQWQRRFSSGAIAEFNNICLDSSGNIYVCGVIDQGGGVTVGVVAKYNSSGTLQWQRIATDTTARFYGIKIFNNETLYVTGNGNNGQNYVVTITLKADGTTSGGSAFLTLSAGSGTDASGTSTDGVNGATEAAAGATDSAGAANDVAGAAVSSTATQAAVTGAGGMVWLKDRSNVADNVVQDTVRGNTKILNTNSTAAEDTASPGTNVTSFNASGFSLGTNYSNINTSGQTYASWTFRKQPKFFDVVTWTGNGANRTISHNLGSVPGMILVKRTSGTATNWAVYHRSLANSQYLVLNTTDNPVVDLTYWNNTAPTSTVFSIGTANAVNASGSTYVAYLFAHNAGGFGADGSQNVITCGIFTVNGSGTATVNLGYEPQFIIAKDIDTGAGPWIMLDTMRGWNLSSSDPELRANSTAAELSVEHGNPTATGFVYTDVNFSGTSHIYMAIRRGPMRTPTDATKVFTPISRTGTGAAVSVTSFGSSPDAIIIKNRADPFSLGPSFNTRLIGRPWLSSSGTGAETSPTASNDFLGFDIQNGYRFGTQNSQDANNSSYTYINYGIARAPGFFDVVCFSGAYSSTNYAHNLGVAPEMIVIKKRTGTSSWPVYHIGVPSPLTNQPNLNNNAGYYANNYFSSTPTASVFSTQYLDSGTSNYVAYLFATCPGVSKVGSYTGTGATQTISCGFTGGARYVLIKRTDDVGDWWVWDTARGMISGTDPRLAYNLTDAETNANWVYTTTGGFQIVTSDATVNANGGSYIYLAIA